MATRLLSNEKPIAQKDYGPIPKEWWNEKDGKRKIAHEETCRDLDKTPEHLLVDIHDESLDNTRQPHETIARTIARLGSMQLRTEHEIQRLNGWVKTLTIVGLILAAIGTVAAVGQFYYAMKSYQQQTTQKATP